MDLDDFLRRKKDLEAKQRTLDRAELEEESFRKSLQELGFDSEEEAEAEHRSLQKELEILEQKYDRLAKQFDREFGNKL